MKSIALALLAFASQLSAQIPVGYRLETVPLPKGAVTILGLCHKPDDTLAVVTWEGEVWEYKEKTWTRFAENLMEPNGIYYDAKEGAYYVAQKPELTRLIDENKDGICDRYECVTDAFGISGEYHEYHYGPVVDSLGRKYASLNLGARGEFTVPDGKPVGKGGGNMSYNAPWRGWVYRSDRPGHFQPLACGFRSPCGIGMSPADELFITDNQGDWVGSSKLFHVREGRFFGHAASLTWKEGFDGIPIETAPAELAKMRTRACVVFPHGSMANSPTKVLAITPEAKFGPFTGQLLVGEMNKGRIMRVMLEEVGGELQGACVPFIDGGSLRGGCNRMAWAPDGSLYVGHTKHTWAGSQGITRVEWDGEAPFEAQSMNLTKTGFRFTFTKPVNKETASKPETWPFKRYYYEYHKSYGSPQFDVNPVAIESIEISGDGKVVNLHLAELKAWHIHDVNIRGLKSADGTPLANTNYAYTLNRLLENTPPEALQFGVKGSSAKKQSKRKAIAVIDPQGDVYHVHEAKRNGPILDSSHGGFSGRGYADFGDGEQSLEWTVKSKKSGQAELLFRYALSSPNRPLKLEVNGAEISTLPFPSTGGWEEWGNLSAKVSLRKGDNVISLKSTGKSGGNIDHLQVIVD